MSPLLWDALIVFGAQLVYVLLLGLQSLNVNGRHYAAAMTCSFALGTLGFFLTAAVAEVKRAGVFGPIWWGFVVAGPVGIAIAIWIHPRLRDLYERWFGG
jgi:hypothetical protein